MTKLSKTNTKCSVLGRFWGKYDQKQFFGKIRPSVLRFKIT